MGVPNFEAHILYRRKKEQRNYQKNTKTHEQIQENDFQRDIQNGQEQNETCSRFLIQRKHRHLIIINLLADTIKFFLELFISILILENSYRPVYLLKVMLKERIILSTSQYNPTFRFDRIIRMNTLGKRHRINIFRK